MFVLEVRRLEGTGSFYSMYHFGIYFSILVFNPYICKYHKYVIVVAVYTSKEMK